MFGNVIRRGHRNLAHVPAQLYADEILLNHLTKRETYVKAASHEIGNRIIDQDIELDLWMGLMELRQDRVHKGSKCDPQAPNPDDPCRSVTKVRDVHQSSVKLGQGRSSPQQQPLTSLGQGDTAGCAMEKPDPEAFLEGTDDLAQRRGGQPKHFSRFRKAALLGNGDKRSKISVPVGSHA
jgi:hypothetical protein